MVLEKKESSAILRFFVKGWGFELGDQNQEKLQKCCICNLLLWVYKGLVGVLWWGFYGRGVSVGSETKDLLS